MRVVGHHDLAARTAYQPTIRKQGDRWIAYVGHHGGKHVNPMNGQTEDNGTSVIDVTDPKKPKYLTHIVGEPGEGESGGAQMVRVCDGKTLPKGDPNKTYLLRTYGTSGHEIWDVSNPAKPSHLITLVKGHKDTHKNAWECDTGIAYLVTDGRVDGFRSSRITKIYDLSAFRRAHPEIVPLISLRWFHLLDIPLLLLPS